MSITSIAPQSPVPIANAPADSVKAQVSTTPSLDTDHPVEIQKDAFSGALRGGLAAAAAVAIPGVAYVAKTPGSVGKLLSVYLVGTGTVAAAVTGAAAGAMSSQVANNPWKGALVGAATGAALGASAFGIFSRGFNGFATGAAIGAVGGLIGGIAGTCASEKK